MGCSRVTWCADGVALVATPFFAYGTLVTVSWSLDYCVGLVDLFGFSFLEAGAKESLIFLIAWLIFMIGAFVYNLKTIGVLPESMLTEYAVQVGLASRLY